MPAPRKSANLASDPPFAGQPTCSAYVRPLRKSRLKQHRPRRAVKLTSKACALGQSAKIGRGPAASIVSSNRNYRKRQEHGAVGLLRIYQEGLAIRNHAWVTA